MHFNNGDNSAVSDNKQMIFIILRIQQILVIIERTEASEKCTVLEIATTTAIKSFSFFAFLFI